MKLEERIKIFDGLITHKIKKREPVNDRLSEN